MDHTADGHEPVIREEEAIQHPLGVYFKIWILAVCIERDVLCGGLLSGSRLHALVPDPALYGAKSRTDHCRVYAHGVGAVGHGVLHSRAAGALLTLVAIGSLEADWTFFQRGVYFLKELIIAAPASPHH
jgi:hypothetical protein